MCASLNSRFGGIRSYRVSRRGRTTSRSKTARDRLAQIEHDLANRSAANQAGVDIQLAARSKSETQAATARRNIEQMTIRAHTDGYISILQREQHLTFYHTGMILPQYRVETASRPA